MDTSIVFDKIRVFFNFNASSGYDHNLNCFKWILGNFMDDFSKLGKKVVKINFPVRSIFTNKSSIPPILQNQKLKEAMQVTLDSGKKIDERVF